jgi:hypothetical protein
MDIAFTSAALTTQLPEEDCDHFIKTVQRSLRWETEFTKASIVIDGRDVAGWLEHGISVLSRKNNTQVMFIAAIQRHPGADSEFHS